MHDTANHNENNSHYEVLKYLLENKADVNARDKCGQTPLFYLVRKGNFKVSALFLEHNTDIHALNKTSENILFELEGDFCDLRVLEKIYLRFRLGSQPSKYI